MSVKKCLKGLVALLVLILAVNTIGPGSVSTFAKSMDEIQPTETVKGIEVELNDDYFNPDVINLSNGATTRLILKNKGNNEHTFTVEKLGIDVEIQAGSEKTITVTPNTPGTFDLICRYHANKGMVAKIIVK